MVIHRGYQSLTFQCDTQVVKLDMSRYVQNTVSH